MEKLKEILGLICMILSVLFLLIFGVIVTAITNIWFWLGVIAITLIVKL